MSQNQAVWKKYMLVLYVGMWCVILVGACVWLTTFLVGTLGDPFDDKQHDENLDVFDSVVAMTEENVARYLGEWEFHEPKLPGHFHHIGRWYQPDKWNFCVECHTSTPHSRAPQQRAFLNMHNLFISCQVCHVQEEEGVAPARFGWVDITDSRLCENPTMTEGVWGEYGAKIVPLRGNADNLQIASLDEERAIAAKFRKQRDNLNERQELAVRKRIHRRCVEAPVRCGDCHNSERAFLPYTDLGYSAERSSFLISSEVADLVARYETFYIPNLLRTDEPTGEDAK